MTALTVDRQTQSKVGTLKSYPVAASTTIYKGSMVCLSAAGYLTPAADTNGLSPVVGVADEQVDNSSGAAGAKNCRVMSGRAFRFVATSITQAMLGEIMYVTDDQTFDETSTNRVMAGVLVEYVSTTVGWLLVDPMACLANASYIKARQGEHLYIDSRDSDKTVRINQRTYTVSASIIGASIKPAGGVAMTSGVIGLEVEPRINDTFAGTNIHGIFSGPWKRGSGAAGNLSGTFIAYEGKLQSDSGYTGTITGPAAVLRAINSMHGTVTTGPCVIYAHNHEGNVAWTAFLLGTEALGTHSLTTSSDKTGSAKSGTIKVRFNNTPYHIQLYAD